MSLINVWSGAVTHHSATVVARVTGTRTRLAVADNHTLRGPRFVGPVTPTAEGVATFQVTGLSPDTRYFYAVEDDGHLDLARFGRFRTHGPPGEPYSFTFAHATCAGGNGDTEYPVDGALLPHQVSNHPVYDEICRQDPLFMAHGGDLHYYNIGDPNFVGDPSPASYRRAFDDVLLGRQGTLFRQVPIQYMWDDHDFGANDSNSTAPGRLSAAQVYRERVPHYPLAAGDTGTDAVHHSFQVGRVLFLASDIRYYRDPVTVPSPRTMMGAAQLAWMDGVLASSDAELLVWQQGQDWRVLPGTSTGNWGGYAEERDAVVQMLGDRGWLDRMFMITGDSHAMAMDTGGTNRYGGFPIFMFSPLDSQMTPGPTYDLGRRGSTTGGTRGQWGTVQIDDSGSSIQVTGHGWWWSA
ncbi:MAG: alkaline phosphatase D family protein [Actinocatenispora sp.]